MTDLVHEAVGAGAPILLVPAAIGDRRQWAALRDDLSGDHRVITYDVRAYGGSPDPTSDYFDHEDAASVLDAHGVERAVVVGASNGGRIAADLAAMAPERVAALVLVGPALPGVSWESWPDTVAELQRQEALLESGDVDGTAAVDVDLFVVGTGREPGDVDASFLAEATTWARDTIRREQGHMDAGEPQEIDPPLRERLGSIGVHTVVLVGAHDHPRMQESARRYATGIPGASLTTVPGAAHLPHVERPDVVATAVRVHGSGA